MEGKFKLVSDYKPTGDQPQAIEELVRGVNDNMRHQALLGVTGSGKTFTIANVIAQVQSPPWSLPTTRPWLPSSAAV